MDLKNPFGIRNGKIVMIGDLHKEERGLACDCVCPSCGDRFEARLGNRRTHHFSHSGDGCDETIRFLGGMYQLIKELVDLKEVILPSLNVYWKYEINRYSEDSFFSRVSLQPKECYYKHICVWKENHIRFSSSEIVFEGKKPVAIVLNHNEKSVALCIKPPDTVCKQFEVKKYKDLATVCFDASNIKFGELKKEEIANIFFGETDRWSWVYTEKALLALEEINIENDCWITKLQKRQEEERAKQEKEQKRLEEQKKKRVVTENKKWQHKKEEWELKQPKSQKSYKKEMYEKGYNEIKYKDFRQNDEIIQDIYGWRWIMCEKCGKINYYTFFSEHNESEMLNLGICDECRKSKM